ncbi:MAG: DNA-binding protein [Dehalococcoidia bacterium]|nr:MAG: DNA-binding protein [Dehalococcoidia bacterium]
MLNDEWLTVREAAQYLKLSPSAIRKYMRLGKLCCYRQGNIVRFKKSDLDNFLKPVNS